MCSDSARRPPAPFVAAALLLSALLTLAGCGLKGDPLPPLPPPTAAEDANDSGAAPASDQGPDAEPDGNAEADEEDGDDEENGTR